MKKTKDSILARNLRTEERQFILIISEHYRFLAKGPLCPELTHSSITSLPDLSSRLMPVCLTSQFASVKARSPRLSCVFHPYITMCFPSLYGSTHLLSFPITISCSFSTTILHCFHWACGELEDLSTESLWPLILLLHIRFTFFFLN